VDLLDLYPSTLQSHYKTRKSLPEVWKVELPYFVVKYVVLLYTRVLFVPSKALNASLGYRHFSPLLKLDLHIKPDIYFTITILYVLLIAPKACGTGS